MGSYNLCMDWRIQYFNISILPKLIYRFHLIPNKKILGEIDQLIIKFMENFRRPGTSKTTFKKNNAGKLMLSHFQNYCKALVIKTVFYWHQDRQTDQQTYRYVVNWFFTKLLRQFKGERIISATTVLGQY